MKLKEYKRDNSSIGDLTDQWIYQSYDICFLNNYVMGEKQIVFEISSDEDSCEGLVGLRRIDSKEYQAELVVAVKEQAMGKGYAWFGVVEMLNYCFTTLNLEKVYWKVKNNNYRALRFFDKHGFGRLDGDIPQNILEQYSKEKDVVWYAVLRNDDYENVALSRGVVAGCKIIKIKTIPTIEAGELSFFEMNRDVPFDIKRVYYISKVPEGARRGFHAHRDLKQVLFCPYGKIQLILDNGIIREEITLNDPSIGIVIDKPTWREMLWLEKDSVLVVGASLYYDENDYIRSYDDFRKCIVKR